MNHKDILSSLFESYFKQPCLSITELSSAGSNRMYFRLKNNNCNVIGSYNNNIEENQSFFYISNNFKSKQINVPEVLIVDQTQKYYLQEDIGDNSVYNLLKKNFPNADILSIYKQILNDLAIISIKGNLEFDYSYCYPCREFDEDSIINDLNYFKYYFVKFFDIPFNETLLNNDFKTLAKLTYKENKNYYYFMYRDFQTRNIHTHNNQYYYIDFQGGRKGPLQYDLASILFSARCTLSFEEREILLDYYIAELKKHLNIEVSHFKNYYYYIVLLRLLQTLGAYGFRGLYERKSLFKEVIWPAISNLKWILTKINIKKFGELGLILNSILNDYKPIILEKFMDRKILRITINSFSYRRGIPYDKYGNGGGFVFDCRFLPNPGLDENLKIYTGLNIQIQDYFKDNVELESYLKNCFEISTGAIESYAKKGYDNLSFSFGCTGGRHRSVYCAERLAKLLQDKFGSKIDIELKHLEIK